MTPAELAEALVAELAQGTSVLAGALADDPRSEAALTALADLSLLGAVIERHSEGTGSGILARSLRDVLAGSCRSERLLPPGPEAWALHACRAWLDPAAERRRLDDDPQSFEIVQSSKRAVLALGPNWRSEEIAYVDACLTGSDLPALRPVKSDMAVSGMYELAHLAFYATDFGAVPAQGVIAARLAATAEGIIGQLEKTASHWDVGVELILAARYLSGRWSAQAIAWLGSLIPYWSGIALSSLRNGYEQFLRAYHAVAVSALALIQFGANRRGFDECRSPQVRFSQQ